MRAFSRNHPVLFGVLLFFAALLAAVPFSVAGSVLAGKEAGSAVGRLIVGVVLILLFRPCFRKGRPFSGLRWILPALLFPLWNIVYHLTSGMGNLRSADGLLTALLLGLAPAVFEEVIFRGILLAKLRENGKSPLAALWISALLFGAVHLTNLAGAGLAGTLVQTAYAVVVGLVLGAVYLYTGDLAAVILAHALTDISSHIFADDPAQTPAPMLAAFAVILAAEAAYALWLVKRIPDGKEQTEQKSKEGSV